MRAGAPLTIKIVAKKQDFRTDKDVLGDFQACFEARVIGVVVGRIGHIARQHGVAGRVDMKVDRCLEACRVADDRIAGIHLVQPAVLEFATEIDCESGVLRHPLISCHQRAAGFVSLDLADSGRDRDIGVLPQKTAKAQTNAAFVHFGERRNRSDDAAVEGAFGCGAERGVDRCAVLLRLAIFLRAGVPFLRLRWNGSRRRSE